MKSTKRIVLIIVLFFATQSAQAQISNADSMIHKIFTALKNKDEKAFVALYPNFQQYPAMLRTMMKQMFASEQMQKMISTNEKLKDDDVDSIVNKQVALLTSPEAFAEMEQKAIRTFKRTITEGEKKGVDWSKAKIIDYTKDTTASLEGGSDMLRETIGVKSMEGVINFKSGGSDYQMFFNQIVFIPSEKGWFGGKISKIVRDGEMDEDKLEDVNTNDSMKALKPKTKNIVNKNKDKN